MKDKRRVIGVILRAFLYKHISLEVARKHLLDEMGYIRKVYYYKGFFSGLFIGIGVTVVVYIFFV